MKIVAVRDRAIDSFGTPFFVHTNGQAMRSFNDEINREDSAMGAHPEDYDLYELGEYFESTGEILPTVPPRMVAIGKDVKRPIE